MAMVLIRGIDIVFHPLPRAVAEWLQRFASGSVFYGSAALCFMRAKGSRGDRFAWWSFGLALLLWGSADLYYSAVLWSREFVPYPSLADGLWLAFYFPAYAAIWSLLRKGAGSRRRGVMLDAVIGGFGVGSAAAAIAFSVVLANTSGTAVATATNLAYPVGDLGLLALVVVTITVTGWQAAGAWRLIACALGIFVVADSIYLVRVAQGTYTLGGVVDLGWPVAALLIGLAARQAEPARAPDSQTGTGVVVPAVSGLAALALIVVDQFVRVNPLAVGLAVATLVLIVVRQYLAVRDNGRLLDRSRVDAMTDALTGLGNRRQLTIDLAAHLEHLDSAEPLRLTMFDLDGFKQYNDTFGHPAGDQLLIRLATRLTRLLEGRGTAYRMGGDEFCTLWQQTNTNQATLTSEAVEALSEQGEAFSIGCSHGSALLPCEATDAENALRIADRNMYICKRGGRASAGRQSVDVLYQVLAERDPEIGDHMGTVADLAFATAVRLQFSQEDVDLTVQTALLHDIGKMAIPDTILNKRGPLDDVEQRFMEQHTVIGERIVSAAPALAPVGKLVRATHERHDGSGYPDGLAGNDIPLIARIVAVCDTYNAITTDRPYRTTRNRTDAIAELRRCAGTQFTHDVVEAFVGALRGQPDGPLAAMSPTVVATGPRLAVAR
jgi:diguanylate cyclase (GGDEF)-like protein/putative nucleotidyltransferase with HDIG domain